MRLIAVVRRTAGEDHRVWSVTTRETGRTALWPQESERITTKADCYGFAVLMWELATRAYPWLGLGLLHVRLQSSSQCARRRLDVVVFGGHGTATRISKSRFR